MKTDFFWIPTRCKQDIISKQVWSRQHTRAHNTPQPQAAEDEKSPRSYPRLLGLRSRSWGRRVPRHGPEKAGAVFPGLCAQDRGLARAGPAEKWGRKRVLHAAALVVRTMFGATKQQCDVNRQSKHELHASFGRASNRCVSDRSSSWVSILFYRRLIETQFLPCYSYKSYVT